MKTKCDLCGMPVKIVGRLYVTNFGKSRLHVCKECKKNYLLKRFI